MVEIVYNFSFESKQFFRLLEIYLLRFDEKSGQTGNLDIACLFLFLKDLVTTGRMAMGYYYNAS